MVLVVWVYYLSYLTADPLCTLIFQHRILGSSACIFCGIAGHFMFDCKLVEEYIRAGKCKHNAESRLVLPSGAVVSRSLPGTWLQYVIE